jgi:TRAP-type mannitol/chloroaromatic compound transport system substrate-binding protein
MGKINRNKFFKGLAGGIIGLPLALKALTPKESTQSINSPVSMQNGRTYDWKMVTTWPPNFPIIGEACNKLADLIKTLSNSRIKIRVYGGGELVPALEAFDAVKNGVAELGSGSPYYWAGKIPAAQFFSTVPFGMNAQQMNAWILVGEGYELWKELYKPHNLIPFAGGNTGVQMGGWFNKPIESVADLKSLKMRIPGIGGKVLEKAGGTPVLLAGGELYTGLERGIIDATEWLGPFHDQSMGFQDIAAYYYAPGWHEPGTLLEFFVNKEVFDDLPIDLQQIVETACLSINHWVLSKMEAANAEALQTLIKSGVRIRTFPEQVVEQLRKYTETVITEMTNKDELSKKIYTSYIKFQTQSANYAAYTEKVYHNLIQKESKTT